MSGTTAQIVGPDPPGLDVDAVLQRLRQQQMGVRDPAVAPLMQKIKEAPPAAPGATPDAAPLAPGFDRFVQQESGGQQFGQDGKPLVPKNFAGDQNDPPTGAAQVRPSTARDALAKVGQPLDLNRLSTDKAYNVWVGNLIHNQLLQQYGNNAMLAAAAYNAGPGAVDSWIKQFGDPRKGEISNEDFAARIPYDETRLYVHAVGAVQGGRAAPSGGKAVDLPFNTKKIFDDLKENMFGAKQEESSALAALNESMAKLAEPPPTQEPTPAGQQWAGAAMALAAVGGLLTHRPFTTAANAMAATMTAVNEGRQAEAKQALEQWKAGHEALIAVTNYRMSLYEAAMKKYQNAPNEAKAELEANAAALQDTAVQDALSKGDVQTAMAIISGGYAAAVTMQRESAKFQQQVQDRLESQRLVNDLAAARATKDPDKIAAAQQALQDHLAVVAPAATAAKIEIGTGGNATLTPDELTEMGQQYLAGDKSVFQNLGRGVQGSRNVEALRGEIARQMKEQGRSGADMAAKIVAFNSDMAAARTLGAASARIDLGAQELQVALPQALELSRKVYRPDFKPIGEIQQAIQGKTSDPDLLEFQQQNQAVINAYAATMSRGGASTVAAAERASSILSSATGQEAYERQLDRLNKEVQQMQYGTAAAKQQILDQISGRHTEVPQPTLTGVAKPAAKAAPAVGTIKGGYKFKGGDPADQNNWEKQ